MLLVVQEHQDKVMLVEAVSITEVFIPGVAVVVLAL